MMSSRWLVAATVAVGSIVAIAGCGGGTSAPPGPPDAPPSSVVREPSGNRTTRRPSLGLVVVHGGSWRGEADPVGFAQADELAKVYAAQGYLATTVRYRAGPSGLADVRAAFALTRERVGRAVPVCMMGWSSGGNLALLVAAERRDVACVVAKAAPTDRPALGEPTKQAARSALGGDQLERFSPVRVASRIRARLLLQYATGDPLIPADQGSRMARAAGGGSMLEILPSGDRPFIHSGISPSAATRVQTTESALYESVAKAAP